MEKKFSIEEAIAFSWGIVKNNLGFVISLQLVVLAINFFPQIMDFLFENNPKMKVSLMAITVIFFVIQLIINIGMIKIFLGLHDGKQEKNVADLFSGTGYLFKYFLGSIVYALIVIGGFLLFIVPGIIWSIKYQFFAYFIVDKNMRPMEALEKSANITAGQKKNLFMFACAAILINLAGLLAFGLGLLITAPLTSLALAYIFRKLSAESNLEAPKAPEAV